MLAVVHIHMPLSRCRVTHHSAFGRYSYYEPDLKPPTPKDAVRKICQITRRSWNLNPHVYSTLFSVTHASCYQDENVEKIKFSKRCRKGLKILSPILKPQDEHSGLEWCAKIKEKIQENEKIFIYFDESDHSALIIPAPFEEEIFTCKVDEMAISKDGTELAILLISGEAFSLPLEHKTIEIVETLENKGDLEAGRGPDPEFLNEKAKHEMRYVLIPSGDSKVNQVSHLFEDIEEKASIEFRKSIEKIQPSDERMEEICKRIDEATKALDAKPKLPADTEVKDFLYKKAKKQVEAAGLKMPSEDDIRPAKMRKKAPSPTLQQLQQQSSQNVDDKFSPIMETDEEHDQFNEELMKLYEENQSVEFSSDGSAQKSKISSKITKSDKFQESSAQELQTSTKSGGKKFQMKKQEEVISESEKITQKTMEKALVQISSKFQEMSEIISNLSAEELQNMSKEEISQLISDKLSCDGDPAAIQSLIQASIGDLLEGNEGLTQDQVKEKMAKKMKNLKNDTKLVEKATKEQSSKEIGQILDNLSENSGEILNLLEDLDMTGMDEEQIMDLISSKMQVSDEKGKSALKSMLKSSMGGIFENKENLSKEQIKEKMVQKMSKMASGQCKEEIIGQIQEENKAKSVKIEKIVKNEKVEQALMEMAGVSDLSKLSKGQLKELAKNGNLPQEILESIEDLIEFQENSADENTLFIKSEGKSGGKSQKISKNSEKILKELTGSQDISQLSKAELEKLAQNGGLPQEVLQSIGNLIENKNEEQKNLQKVEMKKKAEKEKKESQKLEDMTKKIMENSENIQNFLSKLSPEQLANLSQAELTALIAKECGLEGQDNEALGAILQSMIGNMENLTAEEISEKFSQSVKLTSSKEGKAKLKAQAAEQMAIQENEKSISSLVENISAQSDQISQILAQMDPEQLAKLTKEELNALIAQKLGIDPNSKELDAFIQASFGEIFSQENLTEEEKREKLLGQVARIKNEKDFAQKMISESSQNVGKTEAQIEESKISKLIEKIGQNPQEILDIISHLSAEQLKNLTPEELAKLVAEKLGVDPSEIGKIQAILQSTCGGIFENIGNMTSEEIKAAMCKSIQGIKNQSGEILAGEIATKIESQKNEGKCEKLFAQMQSRSEEISQVLGKLSAEQLSKMSEGEIAQFIAQEMGIEMSEMNCNFIQGIVHSTFGDLIQNTENLSPEKLKEKMIEKMKDIQNIQNPQEISQMIKNSTEATKNLKKEKLIQEIAKNSQISIENLENLSEAELQQLSCQISSTLGDAKEAQKLLEKITSQTEEKNCAKFADKTKQAMEILAGLDPELIKNMTQDQINELICQKMNLNEGDMASMKCIISGVLSDISENSENLSGDELKAKILANGQKLSENSAQLSQILVESSINEKMAGKEKKIESIIALVGNKSDDILKIIGAMSPEQLASLSSEELAQLIGKELKLDGSEESKKILENLLGSLGNPKNLQKNLEAKLHQIKENGGDISKAILSEEKSKAEDLKQGKKMENLIKNVSNNCDQISNQIAQLDSNEMSVEKCIEIYAKSMGLDPDNLSEENQEMIKQMMKAMVGSNDLENISGDILKEKILQNLTNFDQNETKMSKKLAQEIASNQKAGQIESFVQKFVQNSAQLSEFISQIDSNLIANMSEDELLEYISKNCKIAGLSEKQMKDLISSTFGDLSGLSPEQMKAKMLEKTENLSKDLENCTKLVENLCLNSSNISEEKKMTLMANSLVSKSQEISTVLAGISQKEMANMTQDQVAELISKKLGIENMSSGSIECQEMMKNMINSIQKGEKVNSESLKEKVKENLEIQNSQKMKSLSTSDSSLMNQTGKSSRKSQNFYETSEEIDVYSTEYDISTKNTNYLTSMTSSSTTTQEMSENITLTIDRLIKTEEEYVISLQYIFEKYFTYCNEPGTPIWMKEARDKIFCNIRQIIEFHSTIFLENMKKSARQLKKIVETFLRLEKKFDMYAAYCRDIIRSLEFLDGNEKARNYFSEYSSKIGDNRGLKMLLNLPIYRLSDYRTTISELASYSCALGLSDEFQGLGKVLNFIEYLPVKGKNDQILSEIQNFPGNIEEMGQLVYYDLLTYFDYEGVETESYLFLFKSHLIITKIRKSNSRSEYMFSEMIKLSDVELREKSSSHFSLFVGKTNYRFESKNHKSIEAWTNHIQTYSKGASSKYNIGTSNESKGFNLAPKSNIYDISSSGNYSGREIESSTSKDSSKFNRYSSQEDTSKLSAYERRKYESQFSDSAEFSNKKLSVEEELEFEKLMESADRDPNAALKLKMKFGVGLDEPEYGMTKSSRFGRGLYRQGPPVDAVGSYGSYLDLLQYSSYWRWRYWRYSRLRYSRYSSLSRYSRFYSSSSRY